MPKKQKYEFNQQFATLRLRESINEGRVMFTIDDEDVDSLFNNQFEADVDYIHDGPDVYYVTDQNDLERFVDYVESMGLDADRIQIQQYMKEEGSVTGGEAYLPAMDVPSKKQNPFKEDVLSGYKQNKGFRPGHTPDKGGFQYKDLWGVNEGDDLAKKEIALKEMHEIIDEVFSVEDYQRVMKIVDKIRYTNTRLYNAIMDLVDDLYPHNYDEVEKLVQMNENYSRFKNETKTRTKPEQFHQAVKSVKRKVEEIHKLYEYMERLKMELSESSDGLKYKKYTENAILKIKEAVKALHLKTKKLK